LRIWRHTGSNSPRAGRKFLSFRDSDWVYAAENPNPTLRCCGR